MRVLIVLCLCGLSVPLSAQTKLRTFTSPDGVFRFEHSEMLVDCMSERSQPNASTSGVPKVFVGHPVGSSVPDSCSSQAGICGAPSSIGNSVACFAYPKGKFKEKKTFSAAAFFVSEIGDATTEKDCLQGSPYWNMDDIKTGSATLNGVTFKVFEVDQHWLGGGQGGPVYRAFHAKKCYELGIQTAGSSPGNYDPGTFKEFTQRDRNEVQGRLKQALSSFRFVK